MEGKVKIKNFNFLWKNVKAKIFFNYLRVIQRYDSCLVWGHCDNLIIIFTMFCKLFVKLIQHSGVIKECLCCRHLGCLKYRSVKLGIQLPKHLSTLLIKQCLWDEKLSKLTQMSFALNSLLKLLNIFQRKNSLETQYTSNRKSFEYHSL